MKIAGILRSFLCDYDVIKNEGVMEFRKIYIKRLLPILGIILVLILTLIGHEALKAQAQVADTKEELRQIKNTNEKIDEDELKRELSEEVKDAVMAIFDEKMQTINLADFFTEEDWNLIFERIETNLIENESFGGGEGTLSEEQKGIINSLISDALTLYSQMNMNAELNEVAKTEIGTLIDDAIARAMEGMNSKVEQDMSDMKNDLVMTDDEKNELVKEISEMVQHDILAYVTEHIQLIYDGESEEQTQQKELVCEKEEHVHSDECYTRELICEIEESEEHTHGDECYEYELICDKEGHSHDDECYKEVVLDEGNDKSDGNSPCVHVHVDYLLTDDDRSKIVEDILNGTDLARVLSSVFYQEIEKTMTDIVKEKMYEAVLDSLSLRLDEIINASLEGIENRLLDVEASMSVLRNEMDELSGQVAGLEKGSQTIRFNDVTGMIECLSGGEWKSFMSASSIWISRGLIYSSGRKCENFTGFEPFAIATGTISYSEIGSALRFFSNAPYTPGVGYQNIYTTDPSKPFEFMAEYNTLRVDYGLVATEDDVSHRKSNGSYVSCPFYHTPTLTIQIIDYTTKDVYSSRTVSSSKASLAQGVIELPLPENPYYIKAYYSYWLSGTSEGEAAGRGTSAAAYIYSMQCVKK